MQQEALMMFDPATGGARPYPSHAKQWREWHGVGTAWLFNPWTGSLRSAGDVGSDVQGLMIHPQGEPVYAAAPTISDQLMDCADRLGSEADSVDPRVWDHLLVYAPIGKVMQRASRESATVVGGSIAGLSEMLAEQRQSRITPAPHA